MKSVVDELALAHCPVSDEELVITILNGLAPEFNQLSTALKARETDIPFAELVDKLTDHEKVLRQQELLSSQTVNYVQRNNGRQNNNNQRNNQRNGSSNNYRRNNYNRQNNGGRNSYSNRSNSNRPICQICDKQGHVAKDCWNYTNLQSHTTANLVQTNPNYNNNNQAWVVNNGASTHATGDLGKLTQFTSYGGPEELTTADGLGFPIKHLGSTSIPTLSKPLILSNILHVPHLNKNLISVSLLCKKNDIFIEFLSDCFFVKDLKTGELLIRGRNKNDLYELHDSIQNSTISCKPVVFSSSVENKLWHKRLGHLALKTLNFMLSSFSLGKLMSSLGQECNSCQCCKSHKIPFGESSLKSSKPLEIIFSDIWGSPKINSIHNFHYYVVFIDHYTRFTWLFPMQYKSDVQKIFITFKAKVEKQIGEKIINVFSDNGGEYKSLENFFEKHGITHLTSPPHTPEHNGISERKHRHIVETGMTLLHDSKLSTDYWTYAFQTEVYLINRMVSVKLGNKSPFELLFKQTPNYNKLRVFGCLYYPWLKPYNIGKLQVKSSPCIFLGYSDHQSSFICLDIISKRIFLSRHVKFFEHFFPTKNESSSLSHQIESSEDNSGVVDVAPHIISTPATESGPGTNVLNSDFPSLSHACDNSKLTQTQPTQVNYPMQNPSVISSSTSHSTASDISPNSP